MRLLKYLAALFLFVNLEFSLHSMAVLQQAIKNPRTTIVASAGAILGFIAMGPSREYTAQNCPQAREMIDEEDYKLCLCLGTVLLAGVADIGAEIYSKNKLKEHPVLLEKIKKWQELIRNFYAGLYARAFARGTFLYEYYQFHARFTTGCSMHDLSYRPLYRAAGLENNG